MEITRERAIHVEPYGYVNFIIKVCCTKSGETYLINHEGKEGINVCRYTYLSELWL